MGEEAIYARSKDDFLRLVDIAPELEALVTPCVEKPEDLASILFKKLRAIEGQMDSVLS